MISGVGFQSSVIIFIANDVQFDKRNMSWGFDDGTNHFCLYIEQNMTSQQSTLTYSIYNRRIGANYIRGQITTIGSNGFTITWSISGVSECEFIYLCLP